MKYVLNRQIIVLAVVAAAVFAGHTRAAVLSIPAEQFAVLAGGSFSADQDVSIAGELGAVGSIWLDRDVSVAGAAYTTATFGADRDVQLAGDLFAGGNVWLERDTAVGAVQTTGTLGLDRGVSAEALRASRSVNIDRDATVAGDVVYGTSLWKHSDATVGGAITKNPAAEIDTWSPVLRDAPTLSAGSGSRYYGRNATVILAPGDYGSLSIDRNATVQLSAGTYNINSVWLGRDVAFQVDTSAGDVLLNIVNTLSTDRGVALNSTDAGRVLIQAGGSVSIGAGNVIDAALAGFGSVDVESGSTLSGWLYGDGRVWLGQNVHVGGAGRSAGGGLGLNGADAIPEPASATLMLLLGACFARRRTASGVA